MARAMLLAGEKEVIPALIGALKDDRVYDDAFVANSETPRVVTVGTICSATLYELLLDDMPQGFIVHDWKAWYEENKHKSLIQLREEARRQNNQK